MSGSSVTLATGYRIITQEPFNGLVPSLLILYRKSIVVIEDKDNRVFYLWRGKDSGIMKKRKAEKILTQFQKESSMDGIDVWDIIVVDEGHEPSNFKNAAVKSMETLLSKYQDLNQGFVLTVLLEDAVYRELLFKQWEKEEEITEGLTKPMGVAYSGLINSAPYEERQIQMMIERGAIGFQDGHAVMPLVFAGFLKNKTGLELGGVPEFGLDPNDMYFYKDRARFLGFGIPYKSEPLAGSAIRLACEIAAKAIKAKLRPGEEVRYADFGTALLGPSARRGPILVTNERMIVSGNYVLSDYIESVWIHYDEEHPIDGIDFLEFNSISEFKVEGKKERKIKMKYYCKYSSKVPIMGPGLLFIALRPKWTSTKEKNLSVHIRLIPKVIDPSSKKMNIDSDDQENRSLMLESLIGSSIK